MTESPPVRWPERILGILQNLGLVAAGLILAVAAFHFGVMPTLVRQGKQAEVPDVRGVSLADAAAVIAETGLAVRDTLERGSSSVPAGMVMDQDPAPGRWVKPERRLRLVISTGGREHRVPGLREQTLRFARLTLGNEGYVLGDVVRISSDRMPANFVMASDPPESTLLGSGMEVDLLVSSGPVVPEWIFPDLRGRRMGRVEEDLRRAGFSVDVQRDIGARGSTRSLRILETEPRPGSRVRIGGLIVLTGG